MRITERDLAGCMTNCANTTLPPSSAESRQIDSIVRLAHARINAGLPIDIEHIGRMTFRGDLPENLPSVADLLKFGTHGTLQSAKHADIIREPTPRERQEKKWKLHLQHIIRVLEEHGIEIDLD